MRLQVSVRRYSLPTTNIVFTTRTLGPSPATSNPDATIAQFLEDVNDIVPLESADWGLEDYAVEVNGYECLHFSPIDAVLRDDDHVVIRALKTQDLRSRRLGGRHQISIDGRHLIDGVAFGRQWLKKGGRPPVQIPPRKRRLKFGGAGEDMEEDKFRPLALTGLKNADELAEKDRDEEEDSDFVGEDLNAVVDDESDGETGPNFVVENNPDLQIVARQDFQDADDEFQDSDEGDDSDDDISAEDVDLELAMDLKALHEEEYSYNSEGSCKRQEAGKRIIPDDGGDMRRNRRKREPTADREIHDSDEIEFKGFSSPLAKRSKMDDGHATLDSESDPTSSGSDSDEDSESGASLRLSTKRQSLDGIADSVSSSDSCEETSGSDSDSDATSENESSRSSSSSSQASDLTHSNKQAPSKATLKDDSIVSSKRISLSIVKATVTTRPLVPPGQGLKRTHYTNQRQKKRHRLKTLKEQGLLPENATFADMVAYDEAEETASLGPAATVAKAIEAKKQELLGQVEEQAKEQATKQLVEQNSHMAWEARDRSVQSAHSDPPRTETLLTGASSEQPRGAHSPLHEKPAKDLISSLLAPAVEVKSDPSKQRARLDLNGTRNMIFNGLGIRKPKTAAAEQALREKLSKSVKGALPKQLFKDEVTEQVEGAARSNESQIPWQSKLVVSAVECELEGVTLKEPPFPFIQGWDEDANRRLRNNKKKSRNQRQYYAYDEDTVMDRYEEEYEKAQDEDDSMLDIEGHRDDTTDQHTTKATNLINEARDQLDTRFSDTEDTVDLPRPDNVHLLDTLQQQHARPGAVVAYKEFHLDATNFQPEISAYRIARIEAVHEDGILDLTLSKRDRKPPKIAKYDEETGKRILSRSEMWEGSDEADEDDGSRHLSYSDLIEPKIVQASTISNPTASMSVSGNDKDPNGLLHSAPDSAIILESTVSDSFALTSAQQPAQVATATEIEIDEDIDIATPRRTEISTLIKEAGFNSTLDSEIGRPIDGMTDSARQSRSDLNVTGDSRSQSRKTSADPASEAQPTAPDTSGFDSPRFNSWGSSPPLEPEPDEVIEETSLNEIAHSSQKDETQQEEVVSSDILTPKDEVTYPHISQLEPDTSMQEDSATKLRGGRDGYSPMESPSRSNLEDAAYIDVSSVEAVEDARLDSLKSVLPPSIDESQAAGESSARDTYAAATSLGRLDGQISSDDDELPNLARITSTARSRPSRVSPPVLRLGKGQATQRRGSASPVAESTASGSQQLSMKQSQSHGRLSQIPPGSQFVDLTFPSDPISPGNSDGDYVSTRRLPRSSNKGKTVTNGAEADKGGALATSLGLGSRRLLKSKKAKP